MCSLTIQNGKWWEDTNYSTGWPSTDPQEISVASMFSGIEAYIHALKKIGANFRHCFSIEQDQFCARILRETTTPELLVQQDVNRVRTDLLPSVDIFCASPPCSPYSSLGTRNSSDNRRDLIQPVIAYITTAKPNVVIVENVLPFQGTVEYESLKSTLSNYIVEDRVLDSSEFGSPQRRKRLFVVAVAAHCIPKDGKIPWPEPAQSPPRPIGETVLEPISSLPEDVWLTEKGIAYMEQRKTWGARIFTRDQKGPMPTFCRSYSHQVHWKHCIKEHDGRLRKLTSREVARLQGFPDSWNCTIVSRTQTQHALGNSIDVHMLAPLMRNLYQLLVTAKQAYITRVNS